MYQLKLLEKTEGRAGEGYEFLGTVPAAFFCCGQENQLCFTSPKSGLAFQLQCAESGSEICDRYSLTLSNPSGQDFCGVIAVEASWRREPADAWEQVKFFMPAYMYNRNRGDHPLYLSYEERKGMFDFPKIGTGPHPMTAQRHMVRGDRLSHPVSALYLNGELLAISAPPTLAGDGECLRGTVESSRENVFQYSGYYCSHSQEGNGVGFTIGYENAPHLYVCSTSPVKDCPFEQTALTLRTGQTVVVAFEIFHAHGEDERILAKVIREVYQKYHQPCRLGITQEDGLSMLAGALYRDAYQEELCNYANLVYEKDSALRFATMKSTAWTGGFQVSFPALLASARLHDEKLHTQSVRSIQTMVEESINPSSGLPYDACDKTDWTVAGWWKDFLCEPCHSSYVAGQACYYLLRSYETEKEFFKTIHSDWLAYVKDVLEIIVSIENENGEVAHLWSAEDGHPLEYDSFSGCWGIAAQALYIKLTGDTQWMEPCKKSLRHYHRNFVIRQECYGTPHDTWKAVDSEGILSFIKASRILHELTGENEFLTMLKDGMEYEFSWKFCWNTPIEVDPLRKLGWCSCGGSVTSVCNPHIHPMSCIVADEIAYLYRNTLDPYYKDRLEDTLRWSLQTFNTRAHEYDYGRVGWMNERFCYSEGLLTGKYEDGTPSSTWMVYLPWGAANVVEALSGECWQYDSASRKER